MVPAAPAATVSLKELFDRLVRDRNSEFGHGAHGQRCRGSTTRWAGRSYSAWPSCCAGSTCWPAAAWSPSPTCRRLPSETWLIEHFELTGETARRLEPLERPEAEAAALPRPGRLYLHPADPAAVALSLHPLVLYDHDTAEVFFLNARRGKKRIEYLGYHPGRSIERTDLDAEQCTLLARVLKIEVDGAAIERWGTRSQAEEPPVSPPLADSPQPRRMGDFELLSELGRGGMGIVYRAWQPSLDRQVALKSLLRPGDTRAEARFHREIHVLGRVEHPNLVKVFTSGSEADQWFYAMELVDGATLAPSAAGYRAVGSGASDVDLETWHATLSTACHEVRRGGEVAQCARGRGTTPRRRAPSVRQDDAGNGGRGDG